MAPGFGFGMGSALCRRVASSQWRVVSLDLTYYRKGLRDTLYVIDRSVDGGTTWELNLVQLQPDENTIIISIDNGVSGYRDIVRDGAYCIDETITPLGFSGIENTDWDNIYKLKPL
jgi:hypothetical protein